MASGGNNGNGAGNDADNVVINIDDSASLNQSNQPPIGGKHDVWKPEHTLILSEWADKAMCYRWLHFNSYQKYNNLNICFTIPVIIISTLTGTANFAVGSLKVTYVSSIIGGFNILAGIVSTIQHFLKISELNEAHKVASLAWDKFYRNVKVELSKCPEDRIGAGHMIKMYKEEYDRLMETCPTIDDNIIRNFIKAFKNSKTFNDVKKPEICDELVPTSSIVYKVDMEDMSTSTTGSLTNTPIQSVSIDNIRSNFAIDRLKEAVKNHTEFTNKKRLVDDFLTEFQKINNRKPQDDEILKNLKDRVDKTTLDQILKGEAGAGTGV